MESDKNSNVKLNHLFKIVLVGNTGVGKSSLLLRYTGEYFSTVKSATIGLDCKSKTLLVDQFLAKFQIWDTAGGEKYASLSSHYYRGAEGVVVVYSVTDRASFRKLDWWIDAVHKHCQNPIIAIAGNKCDVPMEKREVTSGETAIFPFMRKNLVHFEVSAKEYSNVDQLFTTLMRAIVEKYNIEKLEFEAKCEKEKQEEEDEEEERKDEKEVIESIILSDNHNKIKIERKNDCC